MNAIIDCLAISSRLQENLKEKILTLKNRNIVPSFVTILVGENPASLIYVNNKKKKAESLGIINKLHHLESSITEEELLSLIATFNSDNSIHGILVQMPLPKHINSSKVLESISYKKDIDGLSPYNQGMLQLERNKGIIEDQHHYKGFVSCTPMGIISIITSVEKNLSGKNAVVLGRSNLVGLPVASLLINNDCSVSVLHSKSNNIKDFTKKADILVVAVGSPKFIDDSYIKEGAIVIDVGINKVDGAIIGDVNLNSVLNKVKAITPVPKGVGLLTILSLMENVVKAAGLINYNKIH